MELTGYTWELCHPQLPHIAHFHSLKDLFSLIQHMVAKSSQFNRDYVGGDKVYGDKIGRDKIIIGEEVISVRAGQHGPQSIFPHTKKTSRIPHSC